MKKLFTLFAAALVMLAAASCEKNEVLPDNNTNGKVITLKASINNGGTKTSLGEKGTDGTYPVLWSAGDAIAVIQGSKVYKFNLISVDNNRQSGTFELDNTLQYQAEFDASAEMKAFYPYDWVNRYGNQCIIPTEQTYAANSFGNGSSPMAAYRAAGSNGALDFQNLFGALKLQIKGMEGENVQSIEIESSNKIAGPAELKVNQNNQVFSLKIDVAGGDAENCVTLKCEGVSIKETTDFIIALHPNANQLKIKIYTNKAVYYRTIDRDNIITAGTILKMAELADMAPAYIDERGIYQGDGIKVSYGNAGSIIWAPVNCGYDADNYKYGKLYQWGRKYGQGYNDGTLADNTYPSGGNLVTSSPIDVNDGMLEENADKFYCTWLMTPPENNLWNSGSEQNPVKTEYDPCPAGWRVPTSNELLLNFDIVQGEYKGTIGFWFEDIVFFPAAGYRQNDGTANGRDSKIRYWSSTKQTKVDYLTITSSMIMTTLQREETDDLAYGFSVRCVKDTPQSEPMPSGN